MVSICVFVFSSNHIFPGKSHGQRSLAGYSPWGHKRVEHNIATKQQQQPTVIVYTYTYMCTYIHTYIYVHIHIHLGYSPWGCKRIRNDLVSKQQPAIFVCVCMCVCVVCIHVYTHTYSGYFTVYCSQQKSSHLYFVLAFSECLSIIPRDPFLELNFLWFIHKNGISSVSPDVPSNPSWYPDFSWWCCFWISGFQKNENKFLLFMSPSWGNLLESLRKLI